MNNQANDILPVARLNFAPGETIVKEGDYGTSIYQILEGEVSIFTGAADKEVSLAVLGPGEIIGEMLFLSGDRVQRSASAKAVSEAVLEAWHPSRIQQEYDEMPFVIRTLANQTVAHLKQMNRILSELTEQQAKQTRRQPAAASAAQTRAFRKDVDIDCLYLPAESPASTKLWSKLKNVSLEGLRIEVSKTNVDSHPHAKGSMFIGSFFLPNGKRFTFRMAIVNSMVLPDNRTFSFGCIFIGLSETQKSVITSLVGR